MKRHFDTLKIGEESSQKQIKEAFLKLSKEYHPDNRDTGSHLKFVHLKEAYDALKGGDGVPGINDTGFSGSQSSSKDPWSNSRNFDLNYKAYKEHQRSKAYQQHYENIYAHRNQGKTRRDVWENLAHARDHHHSNGSGKIPKNSFIVQVTLALSAMAYIVIFSSAYQAFVGDMVSMRRLRKDKSLRARYEFEMMEKAKMRIEENKLKDLAKAQENFKTT